MTCCHGDSDQCEPEQLHQKGVFSYEDISAGLIYDLFELITLGAVKSRNCPGTNFTILQISWLFFTYVENIRILQ